MFRVQQDPSWLVMQEQLLHQAVYIALHIVLDNRLLRNVFQFLLLTVRVLFIDLLCYFGVVIFDHMVKTMVKSIPFHLTLSSCFSSKSMVFVGTR